MGRKRNQYLREFYVEKDKECECKFCGHKVSNYVTNLRRHLEQNHGEITKDLSKKSNTETNPKETKTKFTVEMSKADLINACIDMLVKDSVPLAYFDSNSFRFLTNPFCTGLKIGPVNSANILDLVTNKTEEIKSKIRARLDNEILNLKIDIISCNGRVFLASHIQHISKHNIKLFCLAVHELEKLPTAESIQTSIEKVLRDYKINKKQLYAITNANDCDHLAKAVESEDREQKSQNEYCFENVISNMGLENLIAFKCPTKILQLSVKNFLEDNVLKAPMLKKMDYSLAKSHLDIVTPCTSTYNMLQRLLELKDFSRLNNLSVSETEWQKIENIVAVLEPTQELIQNLQKSPLLLGDFYKYWIELIFKLKNINSEESKRLLREIETRQSAVLENATMYAALYLDPRFRRTLTEAKKQMAIKHLKKIYLQIQSLEKENNESVECSRTKTIESMADDIAMPSSSTFMIRTLETSLEDSGIKTEETSFEDYRIQSPSTLSRRNTRDSHSSCTPAKKNEIDDCIEQSSSSCLSKGNCETLKPEFDDYIMQSSSNSPTKQNIKSLERACKQSQHIINDDNSFSLSRQRNIDYLERSAKKAKPMENDECRKPNSSASLLQSYLHELEHPNASSDDSSGFDDVNVNATTRKVFSEIENYKEKRLGIDQDLLEYWNDKKFMLPWLRKLALIVHSVPVTQIANERSFAALQIFLGDLHYNLSEKHLEAIMFLRLNEDF